MVGSSAHGHFHNAANTGPERALFLGLALADFQINESTSGSKAYWKATGMAQSSKGTAGKVLLIYVNWRATGVRQRCALSAAGAIRSRLLVLISQCNSKKSCFSSAERWQLVGIEGRCDPLFVAHQKKQKNYQWSIIHGSLVRTSSALRVTSKAAARHQPADRRDIWRQGQDQVEGNLQVVVFLQTTRTYVGTITGRRENDVIISLSSTKVCEPCEKFILLLDNKNSDRRQKGKSYWTMRTSAIREFVW